MPPPLRFRALCLAAFGLLALGLPSALCGQPVPERPDAFRSAVLHGAAPSPAPNAGLLIPPPADPWLGFDKAQHLVVSTLLTLSAQYVFTDKASRSQHAALPLSVVSAATVGVGKEVYDRHRSPSRYFSRRDLVADAVGIALGVGIILL